jgi:adenylate cyclase
MLSPKARRNMLRIVPYGMIWLVFSIIYILLEKGLLGDLGYYPSTGNNYVFERSIFTTPLAALLTGILIGVLEIVYFRKWFEKKSFTKKILYKSLIYIVIILLFLIITIVATSGDIPAAITSSVFWLDVLAFLTHYSLLSVMVYIASIVVVTQFYTEVSESMGPGVLSNFFIGKYHSPIEEERVFMFLDMKSSTEIAEKLGHIKYFGMLKEYFSDLSGPVIDYGGEIYQYAGDEIIVSWKLKNGLRDSNCIRCFFAMKASINGQAEKYKGRWGMLPQFKAGFHYGRVTTGEIGVFKKEIIFTGDVLNTAARIQGLCNQFNVDVLVSGDLIKRLDLNGLYQSRSLGENKLRGRGETMELFVLE